MKTSLFTSLFISLLTIGFSQDKNITTLTSQAPGTENGHLVIVGGSLSDSTIYSRFLELAGGTDAFIVIIPTAGSDEDLFEKGEWEGIEKRFRQYGFDNIQLIHTRDKEVADSKQFVEPITQATGLWFIGGRQWRLADAYLHTRTHDEILKLLQRGGVVGGSSAGASIMGSYLVRGDTKTNVIMMGDHVEGLGLLTNCAIDQHLLALNRQFDLLEILNTFPELLGIGVDENTAIVIHDNKFEVIGQSYIAIFDGTECKFIRDQADWSVERPAITILPEDSERFYLLGKGRRYSLKERKVLE